MEGKISTFINDNVKYTQSTEWFKINVKSPSNNDRENHYAFLNNTLIVFSVTTRGGHQSRPSSLFFLYLFLGIPSCFGDASKEARMRPKKRKLHERPYAEMVKILQTVSCLPHRTL